MDYTIPRIKDKMRIYEKTEQETYTFFLTPVEVQESIAILEQYPCTVSGGYLEAERRIIVIGNSNAEISKYLTICRVECFQKELNHRSILGSILGLGIKREVIGDIIVNGKMCDVIIMKEIKNFILNNFQKVGSEKVTVKEVGLERIFQIDSKKEERNISIASLRLDVIISGTLGISREKSNSLVNQEKVLVNYLPCNNNSKLIKEGDLISVRGYGRIKITEIIR